METFRYINASYDHNGNNGPAVDDPRWIEVQATSHEDAFNKLPPPAQAHILSRLKKYNREQETSYTPADINQYFCDTAAWGTGWNLLNEEEWDAYVEEQEI